MPAEFEPPRGCENSGFCAKIGHCFWANTLEHETALAEKSLKLTSNNNASIDSLRLCIGLAERSGCTSDQIPIAVEAAEKLLESLP